MTRVQRVTVMSDGEIDESFALVGGALGSIGGWIDDSERALAKVMAESDDSHAVLRAGVILRHLRVARVAADLATSVLVDAVAK